YTAGTVTWPLDPERNRFAVPLDPALPSPDHVIGILKDLGRRGLERVGWMEFGLMAPVEAPWLRQRPDLLLRDRRGSPLWSESPGLNRVWLNPALPEVQAFLEELVVEACTRLPLDMVQFDDHLGYPSRLGYDATSLALWRATVEGQADPDPDPEAPAWLRWRSEQVTALLQRLRQAMRRSCPRVRLSLAPNPREFSYRHSLADWAAWVRLGLVDELVVQIYRWDPLALQRELADAGLLLAQRQVPVRIGLLAGLRSQPKDHATLRRELALVRARGMQGIDLFFYETVRPHLPLSP
ncbi:MAG: family 10 glycosylhydrolase, partial [Cyanobium sp.]